MPSDDSQRPAPSSKGPAAGESGAPAADLAERSCVPCRGGVLPLKAQAIAALLARLDGWTCVEQHHLEKRYTLRNFQQALDLVARIGRVSEEQRHHPDLGLGWGWVSVRIWTHKIDGLTESDFVLAAKCDREAQVYASSSASSSSGSKGSAAGS